MVKDMVTENFLMMNGDIIVQSRAIKDLMAGNGVMMSLFEAEKTEDLGLVEIEKDRVVSIHEKTDNPPSNLANAGLYLFTPQVFEAIAQTPTSPRGEYEITDTLQLMIDKYGGVGYQKIDYWLDTSYPWDLLPANEALLERMTPENLGDVENNVTLKGPVSIGEGTVVKSGAYIIGPVIIGEECDIGPNCYIRPHTSIGNGCHIGAAVEVKNSIVMNGTKIPHHNYVGDSILGERCNLGAGTKIANLRLDDSHIKVAGRDTGRRKLGAIMGDDVSTGINSCVNIGTVIGNNAQIGPGALAHGVISPNAKIF